MQLNFEKARVDGLLSLLREMSEETDVQIIKNILSRIFF